MLTNVATDLNQGGNPNDTRHMANISPLDQENVSCIFARRFQKTVMREFYQLREKEMEKAATELTQDDVRARAFLNVDKLSMVILQAMPSKRFIPTTEEFREAVASIMGLPSPLCRTLMGKTIRTVGRARSGNVDGMGFNLTTVWGIEKQPRSTFHDKIVAAIAEEAKLAGWHVRKTPEDILITDVPPPPPPSAAPDTHRGNIQQKLIPDIAMGPPEFGRPRLYDIKTLGNTQQYASSSSSTVLEQCRVINERGNQVNREYQNAAQRIDRQLQPTLAPNEKGMLEQKLRQYGEVKGLAFGFYSETSSDMNDLIRYWTRARTQSSALALGMDEIQAAHWVRKSIMHSIGMRVAIGWARLKIDVLNSAVLGWTHRPNPTITPVTHSSTEVNYLPPPPLPLVPAWA